jgi:starvation-inducible DNA-binding protein
MQPNVGLTAAQRTGVAELLTKTLADEYVLYTKTRNFHWNVSGMHFAALHKFFEQQYDLLDGKIDEIAEFIRYFGHPSPGSLREFLDATRLTEEPGTGDVSAEVMVKSLLSDHEQIIRHLRADIETAQTDFAAADVADFLTGLLEDHEKMAWMLRATAA